MGDRLFCVADDLLDSTASFTGLRGRLTKEWIPSSRRTASNFFEAEGRSF